MKRRRLGASKKCKGGSREGLLQGGFKRDLKGSSKGGTTTLATSLQAIRWSYHTFGLRIVSVVFVSVRIKGAISGAFRERIHGSLLRLRVGGPAVAMHVIANDDSIDIVDRGGAAHFLAMLYGRCTASDIKKCLTCVGIRLLEDT